MNHSFESETAGGMDGYEERGRGLDMQDQDVHLWELESEYLAECTFGPDGVCETWDVEDVL